MPDKRYPLRRSDCGTSKPKIIDEGTLEDIKETIDEVSNEVSTPVDICKFNSVLSEPNIYGESTNKKWYVPVSVKGIVDVNPDQKALTEHGLKVQVDIAVIFTQFELDKVGIVINTDDRMKFGGKEYSIYRVNPENFIQSSNISVHVAGKIYNDDSLPQQP